MILRARNIQQLSTILLLMLTLVSCGSKSTYITFESVANGAEIYVKSIDQQAKKKRAWNNLILI
jgi:hypothetical protein